MSEGSQKELQESNKRHEESERKVRAEIEELCRVAEDKFEQKVHLNQQRIDHIEQETSTAFKKVHGEANAKFEHMGRGVSAESLRSRQLSASEANFRQECFDHNASRQEAWRTEADRGKSPTSDATGTSWCGPRGRTRDPYARKQHMCYAIPVGWVRIGGAAASSNGPPIRKPPVP